jgi:hypothetical protein
MRKLLLSLILLLSFGCLKSQVYVRYCYSNFQNVLVSYSNIYGYPLYETQATLKLSFFSDPSGTIPYDFSGGQVKIISGIGGPAGDGSYAPYYAPPVNAYWNCAAYGSGGYFTVTGNVINLGTVTTTQDIAYDDGFGNEWVSNEQIFISHCSPTNVITVGNGDCTPCSAPAAPSVSSSSYKLCSGQSATLTASGSGTINWYLNGGYYSSGASVSTSSAGTYYAYAVTGCGTSSASGSFYIAPGNRLPASGTLTFSMINSALGRSPSQANTSLSTLIWAADSQVPKSTPHRISYFYNYCY